jgi:tRNA 2-selenouridine synthase
VQQQASNGSVAFDSHRRWIRQLLSDYYDPMYDYQLEKKLERVRLRGDKNKLKQELLK